MLSAGNTNIKTQELLQRNHCRNIIMVSVDSSSESSGDSKEDESADSTLKLGLVSTSGDDFILPEKTVDMCRPSLHVRYKDIKSTIDHHTETEPQNYMKEKGREMTKENIKSESESKVCRRSLRGKKLKQMENQSLKQHEEIYKPQKMESKDSNREAVTGGKVIQVTTETKCPWGRHEIVNSSGIGDNYDFDFPEIKSLKNKNNSQNHQCDGRKTPTMLEPNDEKGEDKKSKKTFKKKSRKLTNEELGFNYSLLPHRCKYKTEPMTEKDERNFWENIHIEFDKIVEKVPTNINIDDLKPMFVDGRYLRKVGWRKIRKAHQQVKDKYCKSLRNNYGRKKLFAHHRVYKRMELEFQRQHYLPSRTKLKRKKSIEGEGTKCAPPKYRPAPVGHRAPVQNLAHVLHEGSNTVHLENDLVSFLMSLQHRDLTPEDYDLLLRLDESVAPKTLSQDVLSSFRTEKADVGCTNDVCAVCMENYNIGQERKFLPCNHVFHTVCIDRWLDNSSLNCPIDGLPVS